MIYLDNAATTKIHPTVLGKMMPYMTEKFFNPSSLYSNYGEEIFVAKKNIAELIGANPDEIYFTSGGSESNNWIFDCFKDRNIITSSIEHASIYNKYRFLSDNDMIDAFDENGNLNLDFLEEVCSFLDVDLVSIMYVNNEIGIIQDVKKISDIVHKNGALFHTDAVQAIGHIKIDVKKDNIDFLSGSAHKFGGPKGIGFLYINSDVDKNIISPFIYGGNQNDGLRGGTYDMASIVGMGEAAYIANIELDNTIDIIKKYKNVLYQNIKTTIPDIYFNSNITNDSGIISVTIRGIDANNLVVMLAERNIYVSAGSACHSGINKPSYVLKSIGLSDEDAKSTIRISIGKDISYEELYKFVEELKECVEILRYC